MLPWNLCGELVPSRWAQAVFANMEAIPWGTRDAGTTVDASDPAKLPIETGSTSFRDVLTSPLGVRCRVACRRLLAGSPPDSLYSSLCDLRCACMHHQDNVLINLHGHTHNASGQSWLGKLRVVNPGSVRCVAGHPRCAWRWRAADAWRPV